MKSNIKNTKKTLLQPTIINNVPEITPEELKPYLGLVSLIDVRSDEEFDGELSHIPGAKLVTLGPDLDKFLLTLNKDDEIVFVCRSGARSGRATLQSRSMGFLKSLSLQGGMVLWNQKKFITERSKA